MVIQRVTQALPLWLEREGHHSPSSVAEVKNMWRWAPLSLYSVVYGQVYTCLHKTSLQNGSSVLLPM